MGKTGNGAASKDTPWGVPRRKGLGGQEQVSHHGRGGQVTKSGKKTSHWVSLPGQTARLRAKRQVRAPSVTE